MQGTHLQEATPPGLSADGPTAFWAPLAGERNERQAELGWCMVVWCYTDSLRGAAAAFIPLQVRQNPIHMVAQPGPLRMPLLRPPSPA